MTIFSTPQSYFGTSPPKGFTGGTYFPQHLFLSGTQTTNANDLFYVPFVIPRTQAYAGVKARNSGAADNGDKFRIMAFADDGAIGGPGTLLKDFGEGTLTGAAAIISLASSVTLTPGIVWLGLWMKDGGAYTAMTSTATAPIAGPAMALPYTTFTTGSVQQIGLYVSTAYGAAPSTAVAPTADLVASGYGSGIPAFGLYV